MARVNGEQRKGRAAPRRNLRRAATAAGTSRQPAGLIDFTAERSRHERFVGRTAVLARLDQLLLEDGIDRWVVVTSGPGTGKSALLAAWLARREATGAIVPHHFIRRGEYDWDDPAKLVGSLVAQIAARFPAAPELEPDARLHPAARLDATLRRVSQHGLMPPGERLVILVDGLDEYDPQPGTTGPDPLAAFLPHTLPRGVSLLCASRQRHPYVDMLAMRGAVEIDLDDEQAAACNEATVRAFWEQVAPALGLDAPFIAQAVERAVGNLQHAAMLRKHLEGVPPKQRRVEDIPRGLAALLASTWARIATDPAVVDGLGVLCAAREALTLDELSAVAGWTGEAQRRAFVRGARELLVVRQRAEQGPEYRLHHDSIRGQIAGAIGAAVLRGHHQALARKLATWPLPRDRAARRYALRHALVHRAEADAWTDAWHVASDLTYLEAKCRELGAQNVEADVVRTAERCRARGDEALCTRFEDLARAIGRESHWLRAAPEATAALIWNQLRQAGWSTADLDQHLRVAPKTSFLHLRHIATTERPAIARNLTGHTDLVNSCAVTPDGRHVVSASADGTLKVWDLGTGYAIVTLLGHRMGVLVCAVTPDGRHVVSGSADGTLKLWDPGTGLEIVTLHGHAATVSACAVTPDGQRVVSGSHDWTLRVWELATGHAVVTLRGHADKVSACAVTPDGQRVVSASHDGTLKVWDLATGREVATLHGHDDLVLACAVTPDGRRIVSASADATLKVWDLATGCEAASLRGHAARVLACAVTPDGRRVVSASWDSTLKVWDLAAGHEIATLRGDADHVSACAVTPDGRRVVSGSWDSALKVWELEARHEVATPRGHTHAVIACAATPDGKRMISASVDMTLKVWDVATARDVATLHGHTDKVNACAVTPDARHVVSASNDKTLKVWDLEVGREVATLQGHTASVTACAVMPDGRYVVSASKDKTLKVWDLKVGSEVATLRGHDSGVSACATMLDRERVITASWDKTLKVWEIGARREVVTLHGHSDGVNACAVTPDGRYAVSASWDKTLRVWDVGAGHEVATLRGHARPPTACMVTPDGRHVVSASWDKTLRVWDLDTGACLLTHYCSAPVIALSATAATIIAGDAAGSIWFLDWPPSDRSAALIRDEHTNAISLQRLTDVDQPQLRVHDGVDAEQAVLAADLSARSSRVSASPHASNDATSRRKVGITHTRSGLAAPHAAPGETRMTRDDLLTRLSNLLPSQFKEVLFRAKVPTAHLSAENAPQATRAIEAIHCLEQQHQLDRLDQILDEVAGPS